LIVINTIENTNTYKKLKFSLQEEATNDRKQGNSFLSDNLLFRLTINIHQLNISVINIDSMTQMASLNGFPNQDLEFKNGPMVQEGSNEKDKIIATTDQFIKKVLGTSAAIAVNKRDSFWIMEIGGFETYTVSSGPGGMGSSGFSMGMGMGMSMGYGGGYYGGYPGYYGGYPGYYGGYPSYYNSYTTQIRSYYFYSMLSQDSLEHTPGIVPISLRERISNFQELMFKDQVPDLVRIVNLPDDILVGYYVGKTANFRIYQFVK
jgi:hypothetical protein